MRRIKHPHLASPDTAMYIWERTEWPDFQWDDGSFAAKEKQFHLDLGWLLGRMDGLGFDLKENANLRILTQEVVKSSEIEGERFNPLSVRSSLGRRLGMDIAGLPPSNHSIDGVVEVILDATGNHAEPLTKERLCAWHGALFPTRARRLDHEMDRFLAWFNSDRLEAGPVKAALAHLWFVTIHPFEDGNGRIARAIMEMVHARFERSSLRFFSLSNQIEKERNDYYAVLQGTQSGTLDVSAYLSWYFSCAVRAIASSKEILEGVLARGKFWDTWATEDLNERQIIMLNKLLDGMEGHLNSSKWAKMTNTSQDTAYRDIKDLVSRGILVKDPGGGRSTSYSLHVMSMKA